jgi:hypothetical protein
MKLFIAILCSYGGLLAHGLTTMPPKVMAADHIPLAKEAMSFLDNSPDPFHAVQTAIGMLEDAGFTEVQAIEPYSNQIQPGALSTKFLSKNALPPPKREFVLRFS